MEQNYYQKEIETMSREDMKKLQSEKLVKQVNKTTDEWHENPCFWTMIDRRLEQIGIPFECENYDELEY